MRSALCSDRPQSILVPEAGELSQWEPEGVESDCAVAVLIPVWKNLTTLDMSHNSIKAIDRSVVSYTHPTLLFLFLLSNALVCAVCVLCGHGNVFLFPVLKKLIPKVEFLDLSHNQLSTVENLQVCPCQHCKNYIIISSRSSQQQDVRVCFVVYNQHMFLFVLFPF